MTLPVFVLLGLALFLAGAWIMRHIRLREARDREVLRRDPATRNAAGSVAGVSDHSDLILRVVAMAALGGGAVVTIVSSLAWAFILLT